MRLEEAVCVRCFNEVVARGIKLQKEQRGNATKLEVLMEIKKLGNTDCYVCHSITKCAICQMLDNVDMIKEKLYSSI